MPRKHTLLQSEFPYHITARCINKEWFLPDLELVWSIFGDYLTILKYEFGFEIIAFVLMNNHFHLIVKTPRKNLSEGMNYFMREVSREISVCAGRINQIFGGPYRWCILDSYQYFLNTYKYVYRNPVEAGLSSHCESYVYSSLHCLLGFGKLSFPLEEDTLLFAPEFQTESLNWLNTSREITHEHVGNALKKNIFKYRKYKKCILDKDLIY